jgi:hypothetical protein
MTFPMPRLHHPILFRQDETFRNRVPHRTRQDLIVIRLPSSIGPSGHQTMNFALSRAEELRNTAFRRNIDGNQIPPPKPHNSAG